MNDVIIIANPSSGTQQSEKYANLAKDKLEECDRQVDLHFTLSAENLEETVKASAKNHYQTIVLLGGDGTVSLLATSLKEADYRPEIAILPTGTVNNVAKALGIDVNLDRAVEALVDLKPRQIDVGLVNDEIFISLLSAGTIPESVFQVSSEDKDRMGPMAYLVEGVQALNEQKDYRFKISTPDKKEVLNLDLFMIGLSSSAVGMTNFFEDARYDDGLLHFFGLKKSTLTQQITSFANRIFNREDGVDSAIWTVDSTELMIELMDPPEGAGGVGDEGGDESHHVVKDGDKGPELPIHVKLLPKWLTVLTPTGEEVG